MFFPLFVGALCLSLFCYALLCVHSSFPIILKRNRKLVASLLLSYRCIVTINILWLFLMVPWVGLQYVIVAFPDHTHLFLCWLCFCVCTLLPCGHLPGKGWPLGSCLWCLIVFLSLSLVVSWVRCGTWLYWFLILAPFLTLLISFHVWD